MLQRMQESSIFSGTLNKGCTYINENEQNPDEFSFSRRQCRIFKTEFLILDYQNSQSFEVHILLA